MAQVLNLDAGVSFCTFDLADVGEPKVCFVVTRKIYDPGDSGERLHSLRPAWCGQYGGLQHTGFNSVDDVL